MVALLQMDQDSNQAVEVSLDGFVAGDLPAVCCKTGKPAEVSVTVTQRRLFRTVVEGIVPITKARLVEFTGWRDIYRRSSLAIVPLALVGLMLKLGADSIVVSWAVDLAVIAVLFLAIYSNMKARRLLVSPRLNSEDTVTLRGVHPAFVDAVRATRQPAS